MDGTNNAAERALRPAVVMRKISGGSRSAQGARAWAILASVMRTAQQQGRDVVATIQDLLKADWSGKQSTLLRSSERLADAVVEALRAHNHVSIFAPIKHRPDFEHLEARGIEKLRRRAKGKRRK